MDNLKEAPLHKVEPIAAAGLDLEEAQAAMVLIHGRGASATSILELSRVLEHPGFSYLAPQAANYSWYPYSFTAPIKRNEPWLSSGLQVIGELIQKIRHAGIPYERIVLAGFSQGACLASEFAARNARRYGGLLVFSGGLIGPPGASRDYPDSLEGTPVFIGCSDIDPHIPLERVHETTSILRNLHAQVNEVIYPGMGHTVLQDEIDHAKQIITQVIPID